LGSLGQSLFDAQELRDSYGIPVHQSLAYMQDNHGVHAPQDPYHYDPKPQMNQDDYLLNSDFMTESSDNGHSFCHLFNPSSPMTEEE
jgi:hypothetical protein